MSQRKLYSLLLTVVLLGYGWVFFSIAFGVHINTSFCLFKNITGIPCPSCGITRSVSSLLSGNLQQAVMQNPLGIFVLGLIVIIPLWIMIDLIFRRNSFYISYLQAEKLLRTRNFAIPLIFLVLINWAWNIYKHI